MSSFCSCCHNPYELNQREKKYLEKNKIPSFSVCPYCIWKQLFAFWPSIGKWHKGKCDFSGKMIVTNYSPHSRFPVYDQELFYSDVWVLPYQDIDFGKNFFAQFKELQEKCPRPHMLGINNENCDYCDDTRDSKHCYLASSQAGCENLYYSYRNLNCHNSTDIVYSFSCEFSSSLLYCTNCYKLRYSYNAEDCRDSFFLYDCKNCENCLMCWNLRNKKYCIRNIQYSADEYRAKLSEIDFGSRHQINKLKSIFEECVREDAYHPQNVNTLSENSEGNFIKNSKNIENGILIDNVQDCVNVLRNSNSSNLYSCCSLYRSENCYMCITSGELFNCFFCSYSTQCKESEYLDHCFNCNNCFLCVSLKNAQYCIFNKQYTKNEYETYVLQIKKEMLRSQEYGKFFPYFLTYGGYNMSMAQLYFPELKESIEIMGGYWEEDDCKESTGVKLPDHINDIADTITNAIVCDKTGNVFNYIPEVIALHKSLGIPLHNVTHIERIKEIFMPLTYIKPIKGICYISGADIIHYYPSSLGYKKIVSNEVYEKLIY